MGNTKKVLIADDDITTRRILLRAVEQQNFCGILCSDGQQALQVLEDNPDTSLLITDMKMPSLGGRELICQMKKSENLQQIPIIIVSGVVRLGDIHNLLDQGVNYFVPKPLDVNLIKEYIENLILGRVGPNIVEKSEKKANQLNEQGMP